MQAQFQQLRDELRARFPERQEVIDGTLAALLIREHVLILGPPGTAKSALVRAMAHAFGGNYFERVLTRHTVAEELLGPLCPQALEEGRYAHVPVGMLPEAHFVLVGNVFAANGPVINLLLRLLDERVVLADAPVPLISLFGTTTELPEDNAQESLLDRFLLRFEVDYLQRPSSFRDVLTAPGPVDTTVLGMEALRAMHADITNVKVTADTLEAIVALRDALKFEGMVASDRRWKRSLRLLQAVAFLAGEVQTSPEDLAVLVNVVWRHPRERPRLSRLVTKLINPAVFQANEVLEDARQAAAQAQALRTQHRRAYVAQAARVLLMLRAQVEMLVQLSESASRRARLVIDDAVTELNELHAELTRDVHANQGLKLLK
ncbi:AAA family ATPase [Archangium lipolyticum]|uniref:AAA family ATPase n=1 Tax=Archangium lipolyticum TaxID=2970465 RepID=UPI00214A3538|nr:AAA family ATPase [Archangium lipolyticum]